MINYDRFKIVGEFIKQMYKVLGELKLNEELINYTTI